MSRYTLKWLSCGRCGEELEPEPDTLFCSECGFPVAFLVGKYRLERLLSKHVTGALYIARHIQLTEDAERVIKILPPEILSYSQAEERFRKEVEKAIALSQKNPHIVRFYDDFGQIEGLGAFYVMEYIQGKNLREILAEKSAFTLYEVFSVFAQLCQAMRVIHEHGMLHRDLTPENLYLSNYNGTPNYLKIVGFGLAYAVQETTRQNLGVLESKTRQGVLGTPHYMSPEQCQGAMSGIGSDIYTMGVLLYELLTGSPPFPSPERPEASLLEILESHLIEPPMALDMRRPDLVFPEKLQQIVSCALAKDPQERFHSSKEFGDALAELGAFWQKTPEDDQGWLSSLQEDTLPSFAPLSLDDEKPVKEEGLEEEFLRQNPSLTPDALARLGVPFGQKKTNLYPPNPLVGRRDNLLMLTRLFTGGSRLVTVLGPAGIGKTNLASHYGIRKLPEYWKEGGVWFCDLTEVTSLFGILEAVSHTLSVPLTQGRLLKDSLEQLGYAIAGRAKIFLLLDSFDHVIEYASDTLELWLKRAPLARFLVTSRQRLISPSESCLNLPPLSQEESIKLFLQRAKTEKDSIKISKEEEEVISQIVTPLEGIPLAIELEAARVPFFSLQKMQERIQNREKNEHLPKRPTWQGALWTAIDSSWKLLMPWEKDSLAQCAVFRGGFTLEAAEAVLALSAYPEASSVLRVLEILQDKSLLRSFSHPEAPEQARFFMYESIREYALEKLKHSGEQKKVETRHQHYFLEKGNTLVKGVESTKGALCLSLLALEIENLLAIYQRTKDQDPKSFVAVALVLDVLFSIRGPFDRHLPLLDDAIAFANSPKEKAQTLLARGRTKRERGRMNEANDDLANALQYAQQLKDQEMIGKILLQQSIVCIRQGLIKESETLVLKALRFQYQSKNQTQQGLCLNHLGEIYTRRGQLNKSEELYRKALSVHREVGNQRAEILCLANLGNLHAERSQLPEAEALYQGALYLLRQQGDRRQGALCLMNLGGVCLEQGRPKESEALLKRSLSIFREVGDRHAEGICLGNLGFLSIERNDPPNAEAYLQQSLKIHRETGNLYSEGLCLGNLGLFAMRWGNIHEAESYYRQALERLARVGDYRHRGVFLNYRAIIASKQNRLEDTKRFLQEARTHLEKLGDPASLMLCQLSSGHLHLLLARQAKEKGDPGTAQAHYKAVQARLRAAETPRPSENSHQPKLPPLKAASQDVRISVRLLEEALKTIRKEDILQGAQ